MNKKKNKKNASKILVISDAWKPQINGVVRTYEHLSEEINAMGHVMHVIGPIDFPLRVPMPFYPEIDLVVAPYKRLRKMIRQFNPDHIHIATEGPLGKAARKYCLKEKRPFTTAFHTLFPDYVAKRVGRFLPFLEKWSHQYTINMIRRFHEPAGTIITTTPSLEKTLRDWHFETPMHSIPRGVDPALFCPGTSEIFQDLPKPVALCVARIAVEKNLEAFLSMDWKGSKVIIGTGPSLAFLKQKYPESHFLGKKTGEDLLACYRGADIFVFPSKTDTFGLVLIEAMACGLPVAAYDVTGPRDIITEPYLGILHEDLSYAAQTALEHPASPEKRQKHAQEKYAWHAIAQQFLEIITRH